jgi:hypothetical protein
MLTLLLDLIRGKGPHIFPRSPEGWIEEAGSAGLSLFSWTGQEYLLFDRAFVSVVQAARKLTGHMPDTIVTARANRSVQTPQRNTKQPASGRATYWTVRKITCRLSAGFEPLAHRL